MSRVAGRAGAMADWLVPETRRSMVATVVAVLVGVSGAFTVVLAFHAERSEVPWLGALLTWVGLALAHTATTWWAFGRRAGADLAAAVGRIDEGRRDRRWHDLPMIGWLFRVDDAPSWSVTLALCSILGVGVLLLTPDLGRSGLHVVLGMVLVVVSWINVVVMYAVHYARLDLTGGRRSFTFPDDDAERSFADYVYLAVGAQATFGVTDVSTATSQARRLLTGHSLIAFLFNTVIIALVVSLLVANL